MNFAWRRNRINDDIRQCSSASKRNRRDWWNQVPQSYLFQPFALVFDRHAFVIDNVLEELSDCAGRFVFALFLEPLRSNLHTVSQWYCIVRIKTDLIRTYTGETRNNHAKKQKKKKKKRGKAGKNKAGENSKRKNNVNKKIMKMKIIRNEQKIW